LNVKRAVVIAVGVAIEIFMVGGLMLAVAAWNTAATMKR